MAFDTPDFSPDLATLLKRPNPFTQPAPLMQPGMPGAVPNMTGMPVAGPRAVTPPFASGAPALPVSGTPAAKLPMPTDDPAVLSQVQKPPDLMSYLSPALKQIQSDQAGYRSADEANRIDPNAVKPKLWERLVGGLLGATQLRNPENAYGLASSVVNRRRLGAEQSRETAIAPWRQRLEQDKELLPASRDAAETAGRQATLNLDTDRENRERWTAGKTAQWHDEEAQIREDYNNGRIKDAEQRIKDAEDKYKNDSEIRDRLATLREQLLANKEAAVNKGKDHTAQATSAETAKANALTSAEKDYRKKLTQIDAQFAPGSAENKQARDQALDELNSDKQRVQDAYEAKSAELGGSSTHQDVDEWNKKPPTASQPAAKAQTNDQLPTQAGPAGEKPLKTGTGPNGEKFGYFKSTGQWMLVPQTQGGK